MSNSRLFAAFLSTIILLEPVVRASAADEDALQVGASIYAEECASCHGANLEGEKDWMSQNEDGSMRAPPHEDTGHTWHHSDKFLFDYTKLGGAEMLKRLGVTGVKSGMPPFSEHLNDDQITEVLEFIKSKWSTRTRNHQEKRNQQSN